MTPGVGLGFVLKNPRNLMGWVRKPANADTPRGEVQNMARWSRPLLHQEWVAYHIKDTGMGPMVWEVKSASFWMKHEDQVVGPYWLVVARNVLEPNEIKYFLSNASAGVPLEVILHVAFRRWPVERCLEDEKTELGLGHFEVRKYGAILRHLRITQVTHLFLARQTERLRGKKSGGDDLPGADGGQRAAGCAGAERGGSEAAAGQDVPDSSGNTASECQVTRLAHESAPARAAGDRDLREATAVLYSAAERVAL
jgi:hypothetical protein